jgi:lambda family phage portal protein
MARRDPEIRLKELQTKAAIEHLRAFEGAKKSRRTDGWLTNLAGPNADIKAALGTLIQRHQDLVDSDPYCKRAIDVIVSNWIGEGVEGAPRGGTKAFARGWDEWASSTDCDYHGRCNFYGLQELAARTIATRGSVLARQRVEPTLTRSGLVPLQLQLMEPDWLDTGKDNGVSVIGGKEYDAEGRWLGAWLYDHHPGDASFGRLRMSSSFVPASELLHVFEMRRPGQYTGIPWGTSVLLRARDIADYESAEVLKQKLAACFAAFITDTDLESDREGDELTETIEPGLLQRLAPGQSIELATPPRVEGYDSFMRSNLRAIAMGYGITYEALTGDLTNVNFSSGRMGFLEFSRNIARWRWNILVPQLLDPVARWYADLAQVTSGGRVPRRMTWTPPLREMINPAEEIKWLAEAVKAGFMTLSEVQRSFGYVPSDLLDELAEDLTQARLRGLALTVDGQMDVGRLQARAFAEKEKDLNGDGKPGDGVTSEEEAAAEAAAEGEAEAALQSVS